MKSAPAAITALQALIFCVSSSKLVSTITFNIFLPQAFLMALISLITSFNLPDFNQEILTTISISVAPFLMASLVSNTFVLVVDAPNGKPITVQTLISDLASNFLQ
jgi:hypothetical protein